VIRLLVTNHSRVPLIQSTAPVATHGRQTSITTGTAPNSVPNFIAGGNVFKPVQRLDVAVAASLTVSAIAAAIVTKRLTILMIGAAVVSCSLVGIRFLLEAMVERIANDSYDSGKGAERKAIVRDLAEYVRFRSAG
jgi:hypothetical protein